MKYQTLYLFSFIFMCSCATDSRPDISADYVELDTITVIEAPDSVAGSYHPAERDKLERGAYLVVLLGCGSCHTNGAFDGAPDFEHGLAGSDTGIAFTNPLGEKRPGITYPPNITPDAETGIGRWSDEQIADAIRAGIGRHGERRIVTMPWQGYSQLTDDDVGSIVSYLRSIKPISKRVPSEVEPGQLATKPFVYFGVYRSKR